MITSAELLADVCGFLQIRTEDRDRFQVYQSLTLAQIHLLNILEPRFLTACIETQTANLTANTASYTWDEEWHVARALGLWVNYAAAITDQSPGVEAAMVNDTAIFQRCNLDRLPTMEHPQYTLGIAGGFELRPIPTQNVTNGYRVRFVASPRPVTQSENAAVDYGLKPLLVYYATALSATVENYSPQIHQSMMALYAEELKQFLPKAL